MESNTHSFIIQVNEKVCQHFWPVLYASAAQVMDL